MPLPHRLERTVVINAHPDLVFKYFSDSARLGKWWGGEASIDSRPGGKLRILQPGGAEALGEVLEVAAPERIVFTYGYASGKPVPPGGSRVSVHVAPDEGGTRLHLVHEFEDAQTRDLFVQGWRFQLSMLANAAANEAHANAGATVDEWFTAWTITDDNARANLLSTVVTPDIRFQDRYSSLNGLEDLVAHIGASQRFMPGIVLRRKGDIRHCQGAVLAEWVTSDSDGKERSSGTSVLVLVPDGRLKSVTSFS
jgi:uncharacterized protein YndB with AHSA1/START domain